MSSTGRTVDRLVAYALVRDGFGRTLLLKRATGPAGLVGLWEPPGGHVDPGEQPMAAAARELEEETGLKAGDAHNFNTFTYSEPASGVVVLPWSGREGDVRCVAAYYELELECPGTGRTQPEVMLGSEHSDFAWVTRGDLRDVDATPAFRAFLGTRNW